MKKSNTKEYFEYRDKMVAEGTPICIFCKHFQFIVGGHCYKADRKDTFLGTNYCFCFEDEELEENNE
jgi:hypothetical protein